MIKLAEYLIKSIVKNPDKVVLKVEVAPNQAATIIKVTADEQDLGQLIGKGGRIIKALQTLVQIRAHQENKRCFLQVDDSKKGVVPTAR